MSTAFAGCSSCHRSKAVSFAHCTALFTGSASSPCRLLFLAIHSDHMPQRTTAVSCGGNKFGSMRSWTQVRGWRDGSLIPVSTLVWFQKNLAKVHSIKTCLLYLPLLHIHRSLQPVQYAYGAKFLSLEESRSPHATKKHGPCEGHIVSRS